MSIYDYVQIALAIIGAFSAIAQVTPNKADNKIADFLWQAINMLGMNNGKAKNDPRV